MDTQIITALINLVGGALGLALVQGVVKWLRGHYNAVQIAEEKYQSERRLRLRLEDTLWATRKVAMQNGNIAPEDLPQVPKHDDH